jgi:hypothetical protein
MRDAQAPADQLETTVADRLRNEIETLKPPGSDTTSTLSKGYTILKDLAYGAADEVMNHKNQLWTDAITAAGVGMAAKALPDFATGAGILLSAAVSDRVYSHRQEILQTFKTAAGPDLPDSQQKLEAEQQLAGIGAASVRVATAAVAGFIGCKAHRLWPFAPFNKFEALANKAFEPAEPKVFKNMLSK